MLDDPSYRDPKHGRHAAQTDTQDDLAPAPTLPGAKPRPAPLANPAPRLKYRSADYSMSPGNSRSEAVQKAPEVGQPQFAALHPDPAAIQMGVSALSGYARFLDPGFQAKIGPGVLSGLRKGLTTLPDAIRSIPTLYAQVKEAMPEIVALLNTLKTGEDWEHLAVTLGLKTFVAQLEKSRLPAEEQGFAFGEQLGEALLLPLGEGVGEALKGGGALTQTLRELREALGTERPVTPDGVALDPTTVEPKGTKGAWNKKLSPEDGRFKPNEDYRVGPYTYYTDAKGRVRRVSGELELKEGARNKYQQRKAGKEGGVAYDGLDDGGHLIASMFDGAGERINAKAMLRALNQNGQWYEMEQEWKAALKRGEGVRVDIRVIYEPGKDELRPRAFDVEYWLNGDRVRRFFANEETP